MIIGLAAGLTVSVLSSSNAAFPSNDQASALSAAKKFALDVGTYDYRHLQQDFARVENEATPQFRSTFIQSSDALKQVLTQYRAVATAHVVSAGLVSIDSSKAVVLVYMNQSVTNTAQGSPSVTNSRAKVTLERSGSGWRLQDLKLL